MAARSCSLATSDGGGSFDDVTLLMLIYSSPSSTFGATPLPEGANRTFVRSVRRRSLSQTPTVPFGGHPSPGRQGRTGRQITGSVH